MFFIFTYFVFIFLTLIASLEDSELKENICMYDDFTNEERASYGRKLFKSQVSVLNKFEID